eukprot:1378342-Rhodomonas_salina.2
MHFSLASVRACSADQRACTVLSLSRADAFAGAAWDGLRLLRAAEHGLQVRCTISLSRAMQCPGLT